MATDTNYRRGAYLRICDVCLHRFHFDDLVPIGELRFACKDDARGLTALQISRYNARARPLKVKPNRFAKGLTGTPTYELAEAQSFNAIATQAVPLLSAGPAAPCWWAIYLGLTLQQALRPPVWLALAAKSLRAQVDNLLAGQYGSPAGTAAAISDPKYGGISDGTTILSSNTTLAGISFLLAYRTLGDAKYLQAADRCATFLRHAQCCDLLVSGWTVFPSGGGAYHVGGVASSLTVAGPTYAATYLLADVVALWFLSALVAARSPTQTYGDGAATSFFSAPTVAPLSQMISELTAFAVTGPKDATVGGANVSGLSTTKSQATYVAAVNGGGGAAAWTSVSTVSSEPIALALLGLFQSGGMSATVTSVLAWLAAFTPNPANATPVQRESLTIAGRTGTYDPTLCVASALQAVAPFTEAAGAVYSWSTLGLLSPMLSQPGMVGLRRSKDTLSQPQRFSTSDVGLVYLGPQGSSGLSLQPSNLAPNPIAAATAAAKGGIIWRQPPGHYPQVALY